MAVEAFGDAYGKMLLISSVVLDERGREAMLVGGGDMMEWGDDIREGRGCGRYGEEECVGMEWGKGVVRVVGGEMREVG